MQELVAALGSEMPGLGLDNVLPSKKGKSVQATMEAELKITADDIDQGYFVLLELEWDSFAADGQGAPPAAVASGGAAETP